MHNSSHTLSSTAVLPAPNKRRLAFLYVSGACFLGAGLFLWCGNTLHFYPSPPLTCYFAMGTGGALWRLADRFLHPH